jgi:hypothetical protein
MIPDSPVYAVIHIVELHNASCFGISYIYDTFSTSMNASMRLTIIVLVSQTGVTALLVDLRKEPMIHRKSQFDHQLGMMKGNTYS